MRAIEVPGPLYRIGNAFADIFRADMAFEPGLMHELCGLFAGAAEQKRSAGSLERVCQVADGAKASGVNGSHVP